MSHSIFYIAGGFTGHSVAIRLRHMIKRQRASMSVRAAGAIERLRSAPLRAMRQDSYGAAAILPCFTQREEKEIFD